MASEEDSSDSGTYPAGRLTGLAARLASVCFALGKHRTGPGSGQKNPGGSAEGYFLAFSARLTASFDSLKHARWPESVTQINRN